MNRSEVMDKIVQIFKKVFDDEELIVSSNTCAEDIEDWDSLEQINLILNMEKTFSLKFNVSEVAQLNNVGEMVDLILRRCTKEGEL
jgi:acyl carrier protein